MNYNEANLDLVFEENILESFLISSLNIVVLKRK